MNIAIAVFENNWVEMQILFKFMTAFGITIEGQDTYGDRVQKVKGDFLFVNNETKIAKWMSKEEVIELSDKEFYYHLHYDAMLYNLKKMYTNIEIAYIEDHVFMVLGSDDEYCGVQCPTHCTELNKPIGD